MKDVVYLLGETVVMDVLIRASDSTLGFWEAVILPWRRMWQLRQQAIFERDHLQKENVTIPEGPPDSDCWMSPSIDTLREMMVETLGEQGYKPNFIYFHNRQRADFEELAVEVMAGEW